MPYSESLAAVPPAPARAAHPAAGLPAAGLSLSAVSVWSQPPRLAADALTGLYAANVEQAARAWAEARRQPLAALIVTAVQRGWLDPARLDAALADSHPHQALHTLAGDGLAALVDWLETVRRRWSAPAEAATAPWLCLSLEGGDYGEPHLLAAADNNWDYDFNLEALPPALTTAVYRALRLLAYGLGDGLLTTEARELGAYDEDLAIYEELRAAGLTDDPNGALAFLNAQDWNCYGLATPADMADWLARAGRRCAPPPFWVTAVTDAWEEERRGERLLRQVWGWRRDQPDLYRHPWGRLARRTALVWRRWRRTRPDIEADLDSEPTDTDVPLGYAALIGLGQPGDADLIEELQNALYQAGEQPCRRWRFEPATATAVLWWLEGLALMHGLLGWAAAIESSGTTA